MVLAVAGLSSCAGSAAQGLRPADPTYAHAVGQRCVTGDGNPQPLIVDWRPEARADLEVAMRTGVAVVAYDCVALRVLPDCRLDGSYGFVGVSYKDQKLHLETTDEIKANLPSGMIVAAGAELARGASLDVALTIVGKQMATVSDGTVAQLRGRCDGATHFVRAVTAGAFTLDTKTSAAVDAKLAVAGAGGSTKGASGKQWHQEDGDRNACLTATPEAAAPPANCGAPLRLDLVVLAAATPAPVAVATTRDTAGGGLGSTTSPVGACPRGLVWSDGVCREARTDTPHRCPKDNAAECRRQCDLGDAGSCSDLGFMHMVGRHVPLDRRQATELFDRACDGGDLHGCNNIGAMLIMRDAVPIPDLRRAMALFETVCAQEPTLCTNLAVVYRDGIHSKARPERATELFSRACLGGDGPSCHDLALAYDKGIGVSRDVPRAAELGDLSCRRGFMHACAATGTRYLYGNGVAKDEATAVRYFRYACDGKNQLGCGLVGLMMWDGQGGLSRDPQGGRSLMEEACNSGSNDTCAILATALKSRGDEAGARPWFRKACDGGMTQYCN